MLSCEKEDVIETLKSAKNLNAALKHVIKKDAVGNKQLERLAKDFRALIAMGLSPAAKHFIEKNVESSWGFFIAVARHAYADLVQSLIDKLITSYGDTFNATYSINGNSISVTDKAKFAEIVKSVHKDTDAAIQAAGLKQSNYLKLTVFHCLFEPEVLKEVLALGA